VQTRRIRVSDELYHQILNGRFHRTETSVDAQVRPAVPSLCLRDVHDPPRQVVAEHQTHLVECAFVVGVHKETHKPTQLSNGPCSVPNPA
jgi:hypothetical protein